MSSIRQPKVSIAYYCSGHGFGHATRVCQVASMLLQQYHNIDHINIISQAQPHIFASLLNGPHKDKLRYKHEDIDPHVVQPHMYAVDAHLTTQNLHAFVDGLDAKIDREFEWLKENNIQIVLCDAPFMPCAAASRAGILTIIISNFTFAEVYSFFVGHLEKNGRHDEAQELNNLVEKLVELYAHADVLLRLPGYLPNPAFDRVQLPSSQWAASEVNLRRDILSLLDRRKLDIEEDVKPSHSRANPTFKRKIIDTPLTVRPYSQTLRTARGKTEYLDSLRIPKSQQNKPILLISVPSHELYARQDNTSHVSTLIPPDWIGIICGMAPTAIERNNLADNLYVAPHDAYIPDLMYLATVILGKLGYGTISEAISCNTPFVYVPRSAFIEEFGLKRLIETYPGYGRRLAKGVEKPAKCVMIPKEDFIAGNWKKYVAEAYVLVDKHSQPMDEMNSTPMEDGGPQYEDVAGTIDGGEFIAKKVMELYEEYGNGQE